MRLSLVVVCLTLALTFVALHAEMKDQNVTVTGTLGRAMAIGAETSGWSIQLDQEMTIEGKPTRALEVVYPRTEKLEKLANQHIKAKGKIAHRTGVETGERTVLEASSIKRWRAK